MTAPALQRILLIEKSGSDTALQQTLTLLGQYQLEIHDEGYIASEYQTNSQPQLVILDTEDTLSDNAHINSLWAQYPQYQGIPFIVMTTEAVSGGYAVKNQQRKAATIQKPFDPSPMAEMIEAIWSDFHINNHGS